MRTFTLGSTLLILVLAGCASSGSKMMALERLQYDYSAAIRWGDFEGATQLLDPELRKADPMTEVELERFKHIQVSAYRDLASRTLENDTAVREIEIGVINKHNMTERSIRYTESWRYDAENKSWWVTSGLPDFWQGE